MHTELLTWTWRGTPITLGLDSKGQGRTVLLLPALSSISTRREMAALQEQLSERYCAVAIDWPGFGDLRRPPMDWTPQAYAAFLEYILHSVTPEPHAIVAAGHAATYALAHVCAHPKSFGRLVLLAPTWRGPLPTMMNARKPFFARICKAMDNPIVGPLLYNLNVNRIVVRAMVAGHVYADPTFFGGDRMRNKLGVTRAPGARFASVRFVTGALDPVESRDAFVDLAQQVGVPMLLVYGEQTPPRSRAEMEALAAVPGLRCVRLPQGKLSVYEEFPDAVARVIAPFLANGG
jgi:pimeloyl-ACP methyl ester carboxylesterase